MMRRLFMVKTRDAHPPPDGGPRIRFRLRRLVHGMRTEGSGPVQETAAIGVGVFIGCLPLYGLHLALCVAVGTLLRLNRLKLYLAANISNPFVAPWLIFAELQAGSWLRRGHVHDVSFETIEATGVVVLGADLLIGSVAVGLVLGALAAWGTYAMVRGDAGDRRFAELAGRASDRYLGTSITAWEFARGKLRRDPIYRAAVFDGLLERTEGPSRSDDTLVDVGCGQGLMLALLAEVRRAVRTGDWPDTAGTPRVDRMVGVEMRPRVARLARVALGQDAEIVTGDARDVALPRGDVVLLFDVLHLMAAAEQERLLSSLAASLAPGGVMLIREADRAAGWRFTAVRVGNRLKALAVGRWRQQFHFRSTAEWLACLSRLGLRADVRPMGGGTPFGNVLFRVMAPASVGAAPGMEQDHVRT
jgi:uncharacterized protein (DUF2062 family)/protein-L-isoaspartate O-methyltransferase